MEKKNKSKNIVLLIGNGFDLAHDLETSYNHFSNWFVDKIEPEIKKFYLNKNEKSFLSDELKRHIINRNIVKGLRGITLNNEVISILEDFTNQSGSDSISELLSNRTYIKKIIANKFLGSLYDDQYKNWFDIENNFFKELTKIKNLTHHDANWKDEISKLNNEFIEIKEYLKEYLQTIKITKSNTIDDFFRMNNLYNNKFNINIINFNYTPTIDHYFEEISTINKTVRLNYIHGTLDTDIIFGYGNDKNKDYQEMKNLEINEFLHNFKTFEYLKNNNYIKLYDDLISDYSVRDYEVLVLGHSLGLTDKTLLSEIFNNSKCKKIHLFKRKDLEGDKEIVEKEFSDLLFSASRILSDDATLRTKIVNLEKSTFFPT